VNFGRNEPAHGTEREAESKHEGEYRADADPGLSWVGGPVVRVSACESAGRGEWVSDEPIVRDQRRRSPIIPATTTCDKVIPIEPTNNHVFLPKRSM
jgi:hypothetical protein